MSIEGLQHGAVRGLAAGRVAVAMSGGVDSSVAAALLLEQGHEIIGVTLRLRACEEGVAGRSCCGIDGLSRAQEAAGRLGIPHYVLDCAREFGAEVLRPAWDEYAAGRTPSPCLLCNERIKFGLLLDWARRLGVAALATGHYARLGSEDGGRPSLRRAQDSNKDQSYFLAGLSSRQLGAVRFPLGELSKAEVRARARALGLSNAAARDSQDACLVGSGQSFAEMLRRRFGGAARCGPIVAEDGTVLGKHAGLHRFTVGQRRGLAVAATRRHWVKALRPEDGAVVVTSNEDDLLAAGLSASRMSWLAPGHGGEPLACQVQVRYRHNAVPALVEPTGPDTVRVRFERPVRAVTPGQAAVFYDGDRVLGRGWIDGP